MRWSSVSRVNLIVLGAVAALGGVALWGEGYLGRVDVLFGVWGAVALGAAAWFVALHASTRRFLLLALVAGTGGLATQYFGATVESLWTYPPPDHTYWFVPATFVFAAVLTYGLTSVVIGPRLGTATRKWSFLLVVAFAGIVFVGAELAPGARTWEFRGYYLVLTAFALFAAAKTDFATLLALGVSGVLVGGFSETLGAHSTLWTFRDGNGWVPPWWLILGSWPLETILHFTLSGILAGEVLRVSPRPLEDVD